MTETDRKSFMEGLRSLDEPTKRKVMFGAVAVSMVLVVYLWLAYFNTIVPSAAPTPAAPQPAAASAPNESGTGIFSFVAVAASSFWRSALGNIEGIVGALKSPRQYNISPR